MAEIHNLLEKNNAKLPKPAWIRVKAPVSQEYQNTRDLMRRSKLNTVCEEAACPNIGECWSKKHATVMILGSVCTRACAFCNVKTGQPDLLDPHEPENLARAVGELGLSHVVITSVDRDDLPDGGAAHFAECITRIRRSSPGTTIEILTPDFLRKEHAIPIVVAARPDVYNHNIETVPRLYKSIRPGARYFNSLHLLKTVKELDAIKPPLPPGEGRGEGETPTGGNSQALTGNSQALTGNSQALTPTLSQREREVDDANPPPLAGGVRGGGDAARMTNHQPPPSQPSPARGEGARRGEGVRHPIFTKSGIMVGLGETKDEVLQVMDDLRSADVDFMTIGQYLQPTPRHAPVARYVTPDEFEYYARQARAKGFLMVSASPLTRSSYHAGDDFERMRAAREAGLRQ